MIKQEQGEQPGARLKPILKAVGIAPSSWFAGQSPAAPANRRGPPRRDLDANLRQSVVAFAARYPWWGYKRLAVVMRRAGTAVSTRFVHRVFQADQLFQTRKATLAELHQASKLFELLPTRPNALWQADVTYIHIPGEGWWYAVTVIDYYSRYLLAVHFTPSYAAIDINEGIDKARAEAERIHGPLTTQPILVTDNGSSFLAKRFKAHIQGRYQQVRTRYRTPEQLGLLERFHQTLKREEVYWQLYDSPADAREKLQAFQVRYNRVRPHWALQPAAGGDVVTPDEVYRSQVEIVLPKWQGWAKDAKRKLDEAKVKDAATTGKELGKAA